MASTEFECKRIRPAKRLANHANDFQRGDRRAAACGDRRLGVAALGVLGGSGRGRVRGHLAALRPDHTSRGNFPLAKRVSLGLSKSLLVQFPFELKDVLVSDPDKVDAVVQSSNRVFLIAKKLGQTNAFFFDTKGQQILTLELSVGADLERARRCCSGASFPAPTSVARWPAALSSDRDGAHAARCASAPSTSPASSPPPTRASAPSHRRHLLGQSAVVNEQTLGRPIQSAKTQQQAAACRARTSSSSICSPSRARSR